MTTVLLVGQINQIERHISYIVNEGIKIKLDTYGGFYRKTDFENGLVIIHSCRYDRFNDTDKQMSDIQNISYVFYCVSDTGPDYFRSHIKNLNLYLPNRIPYLRLRCDGTMCDLSIPICHALALNRCISYCSTFSEILSFCSTYHFDRSWVGSVCAPIPQEPVEIKAVTQKPLEIKAVIQKPVEIKAVIQESVEIKAVTQEQKQEPEPVLILPEMHIPSITPFETVSDPLIKIEKDKIRNKGFIIRVNKVMKYMDEHAELFKCYVRWGSIENITMRSDFMKVFLLNDIKITEVTETGFWIHWDN